MMTMNNINRNVKRSSALLRALMATALAALVFFAMLAFVTRSAPYAIAETDGTITIHVYDAEQEYDKIGGWFWAKGSGGVEAQIEQPDSSEQFKKVYTDKGQEITNTAHIFKVSFPAQKISQFKSGTAFGMLICASKGVTGGDFWARYEKETPDILTDISGAFDSNNHADVYYVRKDSAAYTNVEEAKMALEKVTGAKFKTKTAQSVTVEFEATSPITDQTDIELYIGSRKKETVKAIPGASSFAGSAVFKTVNSGSFDFGADYVLKIAGVPTGASISKTLFIDDVEFIKTFECEDTQNCAFGANYVSAELTQFKVWAPFASSVMLNLYDNGSTGEPVKRISMKRRVPEGGEWGGVWEHDSTDDMKNVYYTYSVNNYGTVIETIDPYAKACGAEGLRGMVVDLPGTDPAGWDRDKHIFDSDNPEYVANADVPIVWEVHISDFSASPDSGMKYKGKYLAFTEQNTHVPGKPTVKTGVNYLKDLGITYVHLNPVYDFATVDETDMSIADDTKDTFNWGYDPQNYNIPEGSYSTDPSKGDVRINEFKQMVMALHNAGIGVVMDVVYNHTYSTGGQALNDTVPSYYHRTDANGSFTNLSGCGNDTSSERAMFRKYMIESLLYWTEEYHIDGFRFDLMGIHDDTTIKLLRSEFDKLYGGKGKKILIYGEPWTGEFGEDVIPASHSARVAATSSALPGTGKYTSNAGTKLIKKIWHTENLAPLGERIAVFGNTGRDGLRGNNDPGVGWASGDLGCTGRVQKMMEGYCGSEGSGLTTLNGTQCVAYAAAHDNYPLWDQFMGKKGGTETPLYYENYIATNARRCKLTATAYLMSSGISFMLAGEEMGRTKYGNHNSYNSPQKVNMIKWSRQEEFKDLYNYFKAVINVRKTSGDFKYSELATKSTGNFAGSNASEGLIVYTHGSVKVTLNAKALSGSVAVNGTVKASF